MSIYDAILESRQKSPPGTFHAVSSPRRAGKTTVLATACKKLKAKNSEIKIAVFCASKSLASQLEFLIHQDGDLKDVVVTMWDDFRSIGFTPDYAFFDEFSFQQMKFSSGGDSQAWLSKFIKNTTVWGFGTPREDGFIKSTVVWNAEGTTCQFCHISIYCMQLEEDGSITWINDMAIPTPVAKIEGDLAKYIEGGMGRAK